MRKAAGPTTTAPFPGQTHREQGLPRRGQSQLAAGPDRLLVPGGHRPGRPRVRARRCRERRSGSRLTTPPSPGLERGHRATAPARSPRRGPTRVRAGPGFRPLPSCRPALALGPPRPDADAGSGRTHHRRSSRGSLDIRPSRRTGDETTITFISRLADPVEVFWINSEGERRSYGRVHAGARREQHAASHVWLVTDALGQPLAVFEADGSRPRSRDRRPRRRTGTPRRPPPPPGRPLPGRALAGVPPRLQCAPPRHALG
ncbi:MAG: hypothetical protein HS113_11710 [Verrucomicrobiales bacterium]|nr:hypothetical protein [Verrucomicrobiales bacterium]